jgi:GGDEF domain-containing protein
MSLPQIPAGSPDLAALRDALDGVDDQVALLDPFGRILHVNRAWRAFAADNGWTGAAWPGQDYLAITDVGDDPDTRRIAAGLRAVLTGERETFRAEYPCHSPQELRWFDMRATALSLDGVGALIVHADITQRRLAERALEHAASHDEVTGLANRRLLLRRLEELLVARPTGILVVRLCGEDPSSPPRLAGDRDEVLVATATLLDQLFAAPAVTGRYGLDQFAVLLPDHDDAALARLAVGLSAGWHARLGARPGVGVSLGRAVAAVGHDARRALARAALAARPAPRIAAVPPDAPPPGAPIAASPVGLDGLAGRPPVEADAPQPLEPPVRIGLSARPGRAQAPGPDPATA